MATTRNAVRTPPSSRWESLEPWNYNGMKERLERHIQSLDMAVFKQHAEELLGQTVTLSTPFSAGQYWVCFELIAADSSLVIARVRLPRHPSQAESCTPDDERYQIQCEVATMQYVRRKLPSVKLPRIYAYEPAEAQRAVAAGAAYMLIEGFYGNTLQDVEFDMCALPAATQERVVSQWTKAQVDIASLTLPCIGSICGVTQNDEPIAGRLSTAKSEGLADSGPFSTVKTYFCAVAEAAIKGISKEDHPEYSWQDLGKLVFRDIVQTTQLYSDSCDRFSLFHMDMGPQNILVDDDFNFVAVIDWEFAQTAPWAVNYYPFPFPQFDTDAQVNKILQDTEDVAYAAVSRQDFTRKLYARKFREAEAAVALGADGHGLTGSFADTLDGAPSRIYVCFTNLEGNPEMDEHLVKVMVYLAFGFDSEKTDEYLAGIKVTGSD